MTATELSSEFREIYSPGRRKMSNAVFSFARKEKKNRRCQKSYFITFFAAVLCYMRGFEKLRPPQMNKVPTFLRHMGQKPPEERRKERGEGWGYV